MTHRASDNAHRIDRPDSGLYCGPLDPPILVIGSTRSGTTILAHTLARASGMCLLYEPASLWRAGHAYRPSDVATAVDATPDVRRWIRGRVEAHARQHGARRVVEKTPQNVLKVPFIHSIFPEAKIIHIIRDGRAVLRSQLLKYDTFTPFDVTRAKVRAHLRERLADARWWEWPAYAPRALEGIARRIGRKSGTNWFGIRYPGWKHDRDTLAVPEIIAKQWVAACEGALSGVAEIPERSVVTVRYEDLVADPRRIIEHIFASCGLEASLDDLERITEPIHSLSAQKWKGDLEPDVISQAIPIMKQTLHNLGYE